MTTEAPNVRLRVSSRPENVMLVREVLAGVAEAAGLDAATLNDVRTAVTEACNNVVLHAYPGAHGPLEVDVYGPGGGLEVLVRDHGTGIRPQIGSSHDGSSGLGLVVIQALADRVVFQGSGGQGDREGWEGTEVCMSFAAPGSHRVVIAGGDGQRDLVELSGATGVGELAATAAITITPARVASSVLPRLLCALAARARFSTDRISDAQLIGDELAARARDASTADRLSLAATVAPRDLQLRIIPWPGRAPWESADGTTPAALGPVIERLTDDQRVAAVGAGEVLDLRMIDQR